MFTAITNDIQCLILLLKNSPIRRHDDQKTEETTLEDTKEDKDAEGGMVKDDLLIMVLYKLTCIIHVVESRLPRSSLLLKSSV